ncbi:MAG: nucleotidyltransferase domain-containing protein [Nitrospinae bacterium]|nr:nucleotidyltransferase domain-containing protein [Nitrospinota bacterium]
MKTNALPDRLAQDAVIKDVLANKGALFGYLFGSHAKNTALNRSDVDIAVFLSENDAQKRFETGLYLSGRLSALLGKEVELLVLNDLENNYLLHDILHDGIVILDADPDERFRFETETQHRILDFFAHLEYVAIQPD